MRSVNMYANFSGEELHDSDEEAELLPTTVEETTHLFLPTKSPRVRGDAGLTKTFFTLIKAFIGGGIMFLPRAFHNGGMLFSILVMLFIAAISMYAFHLLLTCRNQYGGSFGDIGLAIAGPKMRLLILNSIMLSQIGFVCAAIVFVADNLNALTAGTNFPLSKDFLVFLQVAILIPFAFIRNVSKLGPTASIADVFILIGLAFVFRFDFFALSERGVHPSGIVLFNPQHWTMTIGSVIFTFEGISLIIPIQTSMEKPQYFEKLLVVVMCLITVVYVLMGSLCYATFGQTTGIEIISNLPQGSFEVRAVQLMYSLAVFLGCPIQLYPVVRILETKLFAGMSGKRSLLTKWEKNAFRTFIVILCGAIAFAGMENLDKFVSLIGSFACVPLVYIYPPLLHLWGVAETKFAKFCDVLFLVLGVVMMVYTTSVTISTNF